MTREDFADKGNELYAQCTQILMDGGFNGDTFGMYKALVAADIEKDIAMGIVVGVTFSSAVASVVATINKELANV